MAHVTFFRMRAKPGDRESVIDLFDRWQRGRMPKVKGFVRSVITSRLNDPDDFMAEVMFDSRELYEENSKHPEQDAWFRELRAHLAEDPEWFDGRLERESGSIIP
jgi:quinol monooxygenase YgiN